MLAAQRGSVSGSANPSVFINEGGGDPWPRFRLHPRGEDARHTGLSPELGGRCEAMLAILRISLFPAIIKKAY